MQRTLYNPIQTKIRRRSERSSGHRSRKFRDSKVRAVRAVHPFEPFEPACLTNAVGLANLSATLPATAQHYLPHLGLTVSVLHPLKQIVGIFSLRCPGKPSTGLAETPTPTQRCAGRGRARTTDARVATRQARARNCLPVPVYVLDMGRGRAQPRQRRGDHERVGDDTKLSTTRREGRRTSFPPRCKTFTHRALLPPRLTQLPQARPQIPHDWAVHEHEHQWCDTFGVVEQEELE